MLNEEETKKLQDDVATAMSKIEELTEKLTSFMEHKHLGDDGSKEFDGDTEMAVKALQISGGGQIARSGYTRLPFSITDAVASEEAGTRTFSEGIVVAGKGQEDEQIQAIILGGKLVTAEDLELVNRSDWDKVNYIFTRLIQQTDSVAAGSLPPLSFFTGNRTPYITGRGSLTTGSSTFTDSSAEFETDRFINSILNIRDLTTGNTVESFLITGNTATTITVDGEWTLTSGAYEYILVTPVLLGAVDEPWHRVYIGNSIRLGYGPSSGADVQWLKWGTGSPEGVVTATPGSLYLRKDGGATTSLYVKTSGGTGATGWTAK